MDNSEREGNPVSQEPQRTVGRPRTAIGCSHAPSAQGGMTPPPPAAKESLKAEHPKRRGSHPAARGGGLDDEICSPRSLWEVRSGCWHRSSIGPCDSPTRRLPGAKSTNGSNQRTTNLPDPRSVPQRACVSVVHPPDRTSLGITNNTGTSLDKGATFWLGLLDEQQSLREVLTFEFSGLIEAGQILQPVAARSVSPANAKFYKLVYWEYAGVRLPPRSIVFAMTEPAGSGMSHETPDFIITFAIVPQQIGFVLTNRGQLVIRVIWDESAFVDQNARTHRVMHEGIRFIERDRPMPPTPIPPGAKLADLLFPVSYVYFVSGSYGGWRQNPLYKDSDTIPFTLSTLLTLEIGPQKRSFTYVFAASRDWPSEVRAIFSR